MKDLKTLESDAGVELVVADKKYILRASLIGVSGDTLAANAILGFLGPGATYFCRICSISRIELFTKTFIPGLNREKEHHEQKLKLLSSCKTKTAEDAIRTSTGIKESSILNESKYFYCTQNFILDSMHDCLEGQFMYAIKLLIHSVIVTPQDLETFHYRLENFHYGFTEKKINLLLRLLYLA